MITITTETNLNFDFNLTEEKKIIQNAQNVLSRIKGTLPLNRGKGLSTNYIDEQQGTFEAKMTVEIIEEMEREEPRFKVDSVSFKYDNDGKTIPSIKGVIIDES